MHMLPREDAFEASVHNLAARLSQGVVRRAWSVFQGAESQARSLTLQHLSAGEGGDFRCGGRVAILDVIVAQNAQGFLARQLRLRWLRGRSEWRGQPRFRMNLLDDRLSLLFLHALQSLFPCVVGHCAHRGRCTLTGGIGTASLELLG